MKKRGQYTLEFIIIFSVVFLSFLILLAFVIQYIDRSRTASNYRTLDAFAESIRKDIVLAHESTAKFETEIDIPDILYSQDIEVKVDLAADVLIVHDVYTKETVFKPLPDVEDTASSDTMENIEGNCLKISTNTPGGVITLETTTC